MFDIHRWLRCAMLSAILAAGGPVTAGAQQVASSLAQLPERVKVGDEVIVTDRNGRQTQGRIAEISSSSLGLIVGGTRTDFAEGDLDTVSGRDSRWNGTLWGLGVGGVLGAGMDRGLVNAYGREDISVGDSVVFIAQAAGVGAGVGFAIDAMIKGRRLVYSRPPTAAGRNTTYLPVWLTRRKAVFVSLRF